MSSDKEKSKLSKCRWSLPDLVVGELKHVCIKDTLGDAKYTDEELCEACEHFKSKYIEYPVTIQGLDVEKFDYDFSLGHEKGCFVAVRPCDEELDNKTYLGIYLGELPLHPMVSLSDEKILKVSSMTNPAIFVPELKKIVWGCGSWWKEIESEDDLTDITDLDINNTFYVKMLREMLKGDDNEVRKGE